MKQSDLRSWAAELEHLADHLGRAGPDEICCAGLTSRQCSLLRTLRGGQGKRLSDLAAAAGITPSAMTRVLEKLEARQLVRRVRSRSDDARAAAVVITAQGRRVLDEIDRLLRHRMHRILTGIPLALRPQVLATVRVLNHALSPDGCCQLSGDWPEISVCCSVLDGKQSVTAERS
jgi:DNA-binding MarR family transcriptional regulator